MKNTSKNCTDDCANCAESKLITCSYVENKVNEILKIEINEEQEETNINEQI